jgi:hypothetical protein
MTRATRERLLNGGKADLGAYAVATVRIRLPEGLVLQGDFNACARGALLCHRLLAAAV